jgi:ElaB/YqjD/DUF883 family membrane-anchored ribosome-binding protein
MEREIMAETAANTAKPRKSSAKKTEINGTALETSNTAEAKSRFNAALEEARAGAMALGAEARERASAYRSQASTTGGDWAAEAKTKAAELANDGKKGASGALTSLSRLVADNAGTIEQNLGAKYGDYARTASQKLQETGQALDQKSLDQLGDDAREFVRKSPGVAIGIAAAAGFLLARLFRR